MEGLAGRVALAGDKLACPTNGRAATGHSSKEHAHDLAAPRGFAGVPQSFGAARRGPCAFEEHAQVTPPDPAERVVPPMSGAVSGGSCAFEQANNLTHSGNHAALPAALVISVRLFFLR